MGFAATVGGRGALSLVVAALAAWVLLLCGFLAEPAEAFELSWVQNHQETQLWSGPNQSQGVVSFGKVRQWSYFKVVAPQGASQRLYVLNPSTNNYGYIDASAVGPSGPPPSGSSLQAAAVVSPGWVQNHRETQLWSGMDGQAVPLGKAAQWSFFQVVTPQAAGSRLYVLNPATNNYAYIDVSALGPSGAPLVAASAVAPVPAVAVAPAPAAAPSGAPVSAPAASAVAAPPASPVAAPGSATSPAPAQSALRTLPALPSGMSPSWVANFVETTLWSGQGGDASSLGTVPQFRRFLVVDRQAGSRLKVWSPEKEQYGYIDASALGPTGASVWMSARLPKVVKAVNLSGRSVSDRAFIRSLPVYDEETELKKVPNDEPLRVRELVTAVDGSEWYTVGDGAYVLASEVRLPSPVDKPLSGKWIDADLSEPTMVTAYEGDKVVRTMLALRGVDGTPTPLGTFRILRRVENETMDSATIGIPRDDPKGYLLKDVLYTQYFTPDGAALHYNYWLGTFGFPGSHGCLGLNLEDSEFLWNWAEVGTPVVVRASRGEPAAVGASNPKTP